MSGDRELEQARRALRADPTDPAARHRFDQAWRRCYQNGTESALADLRVWAEAPADIQAAAAMELAVRLPFLRFHGWLRSTAAGRCASYSESRAGVVFVLVPGDPSRSIAAFLLARAPLSQSQWLESLPPPATPSWGQRLQNIFSGRSSSLEDQLRVREEPRLLFGDPDLPQHGLSIEAIEAWLRLSGRAMRLPSEDEWSHAARAGQDTEPAFRDEQIWYARNSAQHPHRAEEHEDSPNGLGFIDMLGNVLELCAGDYHPEPGRSVFSLGRSAYGVARGACWSDPAESCRSEIRRSVLRGQPHYSLGLRPAISIHKNKS